MAIRFVSVVGGDVALLPHFLRHYADLGVESFHVIRHVLDRADPTLAESTNVMSEFGIGFHSLVIGPWDEDLNSRLIREVMATAPDDWWIIADLDEFQVYDRRLPEVIRECEQRGFDLVRGSLLDRCAADGSFPPVPAGDGERLWPSYPLAGTVTLPLLNAVPVKVTLARGTVRLGFGQHTATCGTPAPPELFHPQVHHFKWTESVVNRLLTRVEAYTSDRWHLINKGIVDESKAFLDHVRQHGGRLDVSHSELRMQTCGPRYSDYGPWQEVVRQLQARFEL